MASVPGILGDIFALVLIASPITTMNAIKRDNSVGQRSVLIYVGTCFNAAAMVAYSLPTQGYWVAGINGVAAVAELIYTCFYRHYAQGMARRTATWGIVAQALWGAILAVVYFAFFFWKRNEDIRIKLFGTLGALTTDVMYAAMFFDTYTVIRTHDITQQNIILLLAAVSSSITWTFFGRKPKDVYIEVPNAIGATLTGIQLLVWIVVWIMYRNDAPPPPPPPPQQNQDDAPPPPPQQNQDDAPPPPPQQQNQDDAPPPPPQQQNQDVVVQLAVVA